MSLASFTPRDLSEAAIIMGNAQKDTFSSELFRPGKAHVGQLIDFGSLVVNPQILLTSRAGEASKPVALVAGALKSVQPPIYRVSKTIGQSDAATFNPALAAYNWVNTDPNENLRQQIELDQKDLVSKVLKSHAVNCARALSTGTLTLTHDDATTDTIDYGYGSAGVAVDSIIQTALSGTTLWNNATSDPAADVEFMARGIRSTTDVGERLALFMGHTAFAYFVRHEKIKSFYDVRRYDMGTINKDERMDLKGYYNGMPVFEVVMSYKTAAGTWTDAFDPLKCVCAPLGTGLFTTEYGGIHETPGLDTAPAWIATPMFSKELFEQDPAVHRIIVESRPVPLIKQPLAVRTRVVAS